MDRITMAFGPISDVTGFSHKGGMTFLEIQEKLRKGHNDLVAAFNNLASHVKSRNTDLQSAFDQSLAAFLAEFDSKFSGLEVPAAEYAALVVDFNNMVGEFNTMLSSLPATATTDYTVA